jgi:protein-tyrosine phosphatase
VRALPNFRDAGDVPASGGARVRAGRLFRSEVPTRLDANDHARVAALGIGLVCDLRTERERARRPVHGLVVAHRVHHPLHEDPRYDVGLRDLARFLVRSDGELQFHALVERYYRHLLFDRARAIGALFTSIAEHAERPVWIHCTAGRDRTGVAIALLQRTLGVPEPRVLEGFRETDARYGQRLERVTRVLRALTLRRVSEARIHVVLRTQPELLASLLAELESRHDTIEGYLRQRCGVSEASIGRIRDALLSREPEPR